MSDKPKFSRGRRATFMDPEERERLQKKQEEKEKAEKERTDGRGQNVVRRNKLRGKLHKNCFVRFHDGPEAVTGWVSKILPEGIYTRKERDVHPDRSQMRFWSQRDMDLYLREVQ